MRALFFALALSLAGVVAAQQKPPTVRPEVGKPLQAAVDALKARRALRASTAACSGLPTSGRTVGGFG